MRTSLLAALGLATFSEFGLLVTSISVKNEWIRVEWLTIMAIAVSISFIVASPFNSSSHNIYDRLHERLRRFESQSRRKEDQPIDPGGARVVIFGMGRVGTVAYENLCEQYGEVILGVDKKPEMVKEHNEAKRNVIMGDATDIDFWISMKGISKLNVQMILFTIPNHSASMQAISEIKKTGYKGLISAIAMFDDQVEELKEAGVQVAYNYSAEVGYGISHHVAEVMGVINSLNN